MSEFKRVFFNDDMVRAILEERKSEFRRVVKLPKGDCKCSGPIGVPGFVSGGGRYVLPSAEFTLDDGKIKDRVVVSAPYSLGDILYVCESFGYPPGQEHGQCLYKATSGNDPRWWNIEWIDKFKMSERHARIFLKVVGFRLERLNDMNAERLKKEGFTKKDFSDPWYFPMEQRVIDLFKKTWDQNVSEKNRETQSWDANPWVWVCEFEIYDKPSSRVALGV